VWGSIYDVPFETSEVKFNNIFLLHIFKANSFIFIGSYAEIWTNQYVLSQIDGWANPSYGTVIILYRSN